MSAQAVTVVVLAGRLRHRAERALEAVAQQTALNALEVVVADATPDAAPLRIPRALAARVVTASADAGFGELRAAGLRAGTAPLVAYLEDHCYPDPGWAAALISAFEGPWAAVGYAFRVANPESWASRTAAVTEYGQWLAPVHSGPRRQLAGSNVAYRREALERFGADVTGLLDVDFNLHRALLARGERLYVAGDALVSHEHFVRLRDAMHATGLYCGLLAERRSADWGLPRRLFYATVIPVIAPLRRFQALLGVLRVRPGLGRLMLRAAPGMAILYFTSALGEARGYLGRRPDLPRRFVETELDMPRAVEPAA